MPGLVGCLGYVFPDLTARELIFVVGKVSLCATWKLFRDFAEIVSVSRKSWRWRSLFRRERIALFPQPACNSCWRL